MEIWEAAAVGRGERRLNKTRRGLSIVIPTVHHYNPALEFAKSIFNSFPGNLQPFLQHLFDVFKFKRGHKLGEMAGFENECGFLCFNLNSKWTSKNLAEAGGLAVG